MVDGLPAAKATRLLTEFGNDPFAQGPGLACRIDALAKTVPVCIAEVSFAVGQLEGASPTHSPSHPQPHPTTLCICLPSCPLLLVPTGGC
jgi:hypothetical protein